MILKKVYKDLKDNPKGVEVMEKLLNVFDKHMSQLKEAHPDKYKDLEDCIYVIAYGYHFNQEMLEDTLSTMVNDDGTKAPKWTVAETTNVAKSSGILFKTFNEYDWNYTMNMIYSDYCTVLGDSVVSYVKMADKFLNDKDAPEGKALRYAMCMKKDYSK